MAGRRYPGGGELPVAGGQVGLPERGVISRLLEVQERTGLRG